MRRRIVAYVFKCSEDDSIFIEEYDIVDKDTVMNKNSMNAGTQEVNSMGDDLHIFYQRDDEDVEGVDMSETAMNGGMKEGNFVEDVQRNSVYEAPRPGHNHDLEPSMCWFMRGHRKLTPNMKRVLEANDICGIRPSKSIRMLEVEVGGPENLSCLAKDCRNFIENKRRLQLGYVMFYGFILMEELLIKNFMMSTWIEAIGAVHPDAIITDQCEGIRKAIREVMSHTRHKFCLWHILCKVPEKFRSSNDYESISHEFKAVIYDSLSIEMFEINWNDFLKKHGMERNEWLIKLYSERENWVPIYLNHRFWARMLSTQRSEGMHAYFDGYVNSRSTLKQFSEQYEIAIRDKTGVEKVKVMEMLILNYWYVKEFVYEGGEHNLNTQHTKQENLEDNDNEGDVTIRDPKIVTSCGVKKRKRKVLLVEAEAMEAMEKERVEDEDQ
ncbi:hypothetical protein GH714_022030 [Hevea brasiliensis]|uniref:MULE transposase domain-containing protein n=1 Tax=Hevea brasiliensis TaxID=3981 RepID=A0A6A6KUT3_HEVBR|nr:hypothetical protein GH714_022030 [Hevea brasiliensis]